MRLGAHESIAGGIDRAFDRALAVGCETVQVFVKSNRSWAVRPLDENEIARFRARAAAESIYPLVAHTSYLLNLGTPAKDLWRKSVETLIIEMERCEALGVHRLVLHPGSHVGSGEEAGLSRVADGLGQAHAATRGFKTRILLETTSGQGTNLGHRFEQLEWLIHSTPEGERLRVCLDTCHVFAAGYELRTPDGYASTLDEFDKTVGLDRLEAIHLNDSKYDIGSRRDRHEHIGKGFLGLEGFRHILNDQRLDGLPGLLETPKSDDLHEDAENLTVLRSLIEGS